MKAAIVSDPERSQNDRQRAIAMVSRGRQARHAATSSTMPDAPRGLVYGYMRYSTDGQLDTSLDRQRAEIDRIAKSLGLVVTQYFDDAGISGTILARPGLDDLIEALRKRPGSVVIVEHLDRLQRNELVFHKLAVIFLETQTTIIDRNGPIAADDLAAKARTGSDAYRILLARVMFQRRVFMESGGYMTLAPYGYQKHKRKKGKLEKDPVTKDEILRIFNNRASGMTVAQITRDLNRRGIAPPRGARGWYRTTVQGILSNPIYCGYTVYTVADQSDAIRDWRSGLAPTCKSARRSS